LLRGVFIAIWLTATANPVFAAESRIIEVPQQPSLPAKSTTPLDQSKHQPGKQDTAPDNRGTDQVPFVVKELARERSAEERKEVNEKTALDRKLTNYTSDLAFYTECLFGATILLAVVTGFLAWAAYRQMREARKSIDATVTLAKASVEQAGHAERAIKVTEESAERQLRAYIAGRIANIRSWDDAATIRVDFRMENVGLTPAINVRHVSVTGIFPVPLPEDYLPPEHDEAEFSAPTVIFPRDVFNGHSFANQVFRDQDITNIAAGTHAFYIVFLVKYLDVFNRDRYTRRCVYFGGPGFIAARAAAIDARKYDSGGEGFVEIVPAVAVRFNDAS
jgi:hypothetical protein